MDHSKDTFPDPSNNVFAKRGLHLMTLDGPGQGTSNLRKIRVTDDNFERAASAALDVLAALPEVDAARIGLAGVSMGSHWSMRLAARDRRIRAVASAAACYASKRDIFERSSPRFKQTFMYMAGMDDEDAFDAMAERMVLTGHAGRITCPCLMVVGEYDPLSPLDESIAVFDEVAGPKELWVLEDDFHGTGRAGSGGPNFGGMTVFPVLADWLADVLFGRREVAAERRAFIRSTRGPGQYAEATPDFSLRSRSGR
jgi:pimeloyl-ACP methyl ester carboxylesterase